MANELHFNGNARYAVYAAYVVTSPLLGIARGIVALAGLIFDYIQLYAAQQKSNVDSLQMAGDHCVDQVQKHLPNCAKPIMDTFKSENAVNVSQHETCISEDYHHLLRALTEVLFVGGIVYTIVEADKSDRQKPFLEWMSLERTLDRVWNGCCSAS